MINEIVITENKIEIIPLPIHSNPETYILSEWVCKVALNNKLDFLILFNSIQKLMEIHGINWVESLSRITLTSKSRIRKMEENIDFKMEGYNCPFIMCRKKLSYSNHYKEHIRTHTGEKPYKCEICSNSYAHLGSLKSHIWSHKGEKRYNCEICSSRFITSNQLAVHKRVHSGKRPYKCDSCG